MLHVLQGSPFFFFFFCNLGQALSNATTFKIIQFTDKTDGFNYNLRHVNVARN